MGAAVRSKSKSTSIDDSISNIDIDSTSSRENDVAKKEADASVDTSPNMEKKFSYKSPFSHQFNVTERSQAIHTHRQAYSYTYSKSGNSIDSTEIPRVKDLIVTPEEEANVIYAGFFEDFAKTAHGHKKVENDKNTELDENLAVNDVDDSMLNEVSTLDDKKIDAEETMANPEAEDETLSSKK